MQANSELATHERLLAGEGTRVCLHYPLAELLLNFDLSLAAWRRHHVPFLHHHLPCRRLLAKGLRETEVAGCGGICELVSRYHRRGSPVANCVLTLKRVRIIGPEGAAIVQ